MRPDHGPASVQAKPENIFKLPNGTVNVCTTCHTSAAGGTQENHQLNIFGLDVQATLGDGIPLWDNVCALDSDGDGVSNGQEMGDPSCGWVQGDANPPGEVYEPGNPDSFPETVFPILSWTATISDVMNLVYCLVGAGDCAGLEPGADTVDTTLDNVDDNAAAFQAGIAVFFEASFNAGAASVNCVGVDTESDAYDAGYQAGLAYAQAQAEEAGAVVTEETDVTFIDKGIGHSLTSADYCDGADWGEDYFGLNNVTADVCEALCAQTDECTLYLYELVSNQCCLSSQSETTFDGSGPWFLYLKSDVEEACESTVCDITSNDALICAEAGGAWADGVCTPAPDSAENHELACLLSGGTWVALEVYEICVADLQVHMHSYNCIITEPYESVYEE